ncbi:Hematopoietic lineage cell-specific protein [Blyttiomyces sp. JEL0837]|nr:Hematopoietic lineage cell-specific protein [Blyttiomyces sp. JEL0837]
MWKAMTTVPAVKPTASDDDDWETDPDFVNNVSEKDQRWGNQKTIPAGDKPVVNMADLRSNVITQHEQIKKTEYGDDRRKEYQRPVIVTSPSSMDQVIWSLSPQ